MAKLTDLSVKALPIPEKGQKLYYDDTLAGLAVRVSQGGTRSFILQHGSDRRMMTLGRYPIISLSQARAEAKRLLAEFTLGRIRPQSITFAEAVELYLSDKAKGRRSRTVADYRRLLTKHFPFRGQLNDITPAQYIHRLDALRRTPSEYNHALTAGKVFLNWCHKRRYISDNPLYGVSTHKLPTRTRLLTDKELFRIWHACSGKFGNLIRLCILLGQRRGELQQAQLDWITVNTLTIPAGVAKNGRAITLPLTPLASQFFTPPFPRFAWSREKQTLDDKAQVYDWVIHDLRRLFATRLAEMAVPPHVIERLLNHSTGQISGVAAVYNRASYLEEMRAAVTLWEQRLQKLLKI